MKFHTETLLNLPHKRSSAKPFSRIFVLRKHDTRPRFHETDKPFQIPMEAYAPPSDTIRCVHVLAIVAGTNDPSNCDYLADVFLRTLEQEGATTEKIRLKDLSIAHFTLEHYREDFPHEPDLLLVRDALERATGVLIATPVWNFGVPGHLKNLIDRLGSFALDAATRSRGQFKGKPFSLLFTGGVPAPGWHALQRKTTSFLPQGLRYFGAYPAGSFYEGSCIPGRGKFGLVVEKRPETLRRTERAAKAFAATVRTYERTGVPPMRHRIFSAGMRFGEVLLKKFSRAR